MWHLMSVAAMQGVRISMPRAGRLAEDKAECSSFGLDGVRSHALTDLDHMEACGDDTEEVSMPAETDDGGSSPVAGKLLICICASG